LKKNETQLGVILGYLSLALGIISGLILTPIIVRYLGREQFGLYKLIGGFIAYLSIFDLGFGVTVTRYLARFSKKQDRSDEENFLAMMVLIYSGLTGIVILAGLVIYYQLEKIFGRSFNPIELIYAKQMTLMLILSIAVTVFGNFFTGILEGKEKFIIPRSANIIKTALNITLGIIILINGANCVDLTMVSVCLNCLIFVLLAIFTIKRIDIKIKFHYFDTKLFKEIFGFALFIFLHSLMGLLYWRIGGVALGVMLGTSSVAVFALAIEINRIFIESSAVISKVQLPKASKLSAEKATGEVHTDFIIKPARYALMFYGLISVGFVVLGQDFIKLWVGPGYEKTYWICILFIFGGLIPRIQNTGIQLARAYNKQKPIVTIYFLMGVLNVLLTILGIKIWGEMGAAIGTFLALIIGNTIATNIFFKISLGINLFRFFKETFKGIWAAFVVALIVGLILNKYIFFMNTIPTFTAKMTFICSAYIGVLILFGCRSEEKRLINSFFYRS